jgi:DNA-binding PadR family transcriptional regulator
MATRRKVGNMLALVVLATFAERPMHPYELASLMRERGKDNSIKINWGSLYTVVQNLEKHGFVEVAGTTRQGGRPERTVYAITDAGRAELTDWLRELIAVPSREYPKFEAALSVIGVLGPDEAIALLGERERALKGQIATETEMLRQVAQEVPRLFLIEAEFHVAMLRAEANWVSALHEELTAGTMPGVDLWRKFHETGEVPPEIAELADRGRPAD